IKLFVPVVSHFTLNCLVAGPSMGFFFHHVGSVFVASSRPEDTERVGLVKSVELSKICPAFHPGSFAKSFVTVRPKNFTSPLNNTNPHELAGTVYEASSVKSNFRNGKFGGATCCWYRVCFSSTGNASKNSTVGFTGNSITWKFSGAFLNVTRYASMCWIIYPD